jgi:extracellular elastinolytic metalloproteinase
LTDPWDLSASEFTWQADGTTTYNSTRGNNAIAQADWNGTQYFWPEQRQDGSSYLYDYRPQSSNETFVYPFSLTETNPKEYIDSSLTQLFYTSNMYHDLLYKLGFTEAAGNFQADNGNKGGLGGDLVILDGQDGLSLDNADFVTPPDGQMPRMRMYMFDYSEPQRDAAFAFDIVVHEYTHGLSNRLTGGPQNTHCLNEIWSRGLGEGWSDFMPTAIRIKVTDTRATDYVMGAWAGNNSMGLRHYPYSTNMTTNPHVYKDISLLNEQHDIGEVWATFLYEMLWNLIDDHGITSSHHPSFGPDGVPTDGRYLAMQLVINAMAL